jgi:hypothetical protein
MYHLADSVHRAPDATTFLSTTALVVGILVTVFGAAFIQAIFGERSETPQRQATQGTIIKIVFFVTVVVDIGGVVYPLVILYLDTVGTVPIGYIRGVFVATGLVIVANVLLPWMALSIAGMIRATQEFDMQFLHHENRTRENLRIFMTESTGMSVPQFDELFDAFSANVDYKELRPMFRAFCRRIRQRGGPLVNNPLFGWLYLRWVIREDPKNRSILRGYRMELVRIFRMAQVLALQPGA